MTICERWLQERLSKEDIILCDIIREEGKKLGFNKKEMKEARKNLGIETINDWAANEGETLNWFWRLTKKG